MKPRIQRPVPPNVEPAKAAGIFGRQWFLAVAFRVATPAKPADSRQARTA
jgi:hypothetical protein